MRINKHDTNGTKPLLGKGELGYDDYTVGGDAGRVYVGTGSVNIPQAKKAEVVAVDGKVDTHVARVDNPHTVTKAQVGLGAVDNTADSSKVVASAGKWTTSRNITIGNSTKSVDGAGNVAWTLAEIDAISPASPALTGVPTAPTAAVNTNTTQLATTAFVNAEIANDAVPRVTSTDNAVARFDGTTGALQNSSVIIDDNNNIGIGVTPSAWHTNISAIDFGYDGNIYARKSGDGVFIGSNYYSNNADGITSIYKSSFYASVYRQGEGTHRWYTAPSGTAGNAITWTNAMTLDATSRLSITNGLASGWNGSSYSATTNGIEDYKVSSYNVTGIYGRTTADTSYVYSALVAGALKSAILANGNFQSATNSYGSTSDAKLKENVVDTSDKLDKLMNVRVVNFNYIGVCFP